MEDNFYDDILDRLKSFIVGQRDSFESDEIYNLEYIEKRHIIKALRKYKTNICKTSDTLGISRNTLYSKIKKYQIDLS